MFKCKISKVFMSALIVYIQIANVYWWIILTHNYKNVRENSKCLYKRFGEISNVYILLVNVYMKNATY